MSWQLSEGATRYKLIQTDSDGTLIFSNDFGNINSTIVYNLVQSVKYIFTIYSGNENGFDLSEGRSATLSIDCPFLFIIFHFHFSFVFLHFLNEIILGVQCLSIIEGNAYWPPTRSGERTGIPSFLFFF